jgi:glycosyltransferase involved in cell wall biosynthesis
LVESGRSLQATVVGVSTSPTCGVRDHAVLLAEALGRENVACSLQWLWRTGGSIETGRSEIRAWTRRLAADLDRDQPDVVLLHYSVFAYSHRGLPLFVRPTLSALTGSRVPLVTLLHEFAYPWHRGGVRGKAWAVTQRAILFEVMRASAAVAVTTPHRAEWLASRVWLPRRQAAVAPVFSNLPPPAATPIEGARGRVIGLFGYSYEGASVSLVLDAVRRLEDRGVAAQLILLGAPGRSSPAAEAWLEGARRSGVAHSPTFSGRLSAQDLSDALAACDVLLSADPSGPTSQKTTLAASLASGRAVVALEGPRSWSELIRSEAALVVQPEADALADALVGLLKDDRRREALGVRGRAFAQEAMGVARSADVIARLLEDVLSGSSTGPGS